MERINLPNGCYWQETNSRNNAGNVYAVDGRVLMLNVIGMEAQKLAEAMRPVVTPDDEDVAREIAETCLVTTKLTLDPDELPRQRIDEWKVAAILARHRQPVAVSADAVRMCEALEELRGELCRTEAPTSHKALFRRLHAIVNAALSHETVCGGE